MSCCKDLTSYMNTPCVQHGNNCPDNPICYIPKFREYGIKLGEFWKCETGWEFLHIHFCPWCGTKFAPSLRTEWFDEMDKRGIDVFGEVPEEFKTDKWWNK